MFKYKNNSKLISQRFLFSEEGIKIKLNVHPFIVGSGLLLFIQQRVNGLSRHDQLQSAIGLVEEIHVEIVIGTGTNDN